MCSPHHRFTAHQIWEVRLGRGRRHYVACEDQIEKPGAKRSI
jgi:hypothetical protein